MAAQRGGHRDHDGGQPGRHQPEQHQASAGLQLHLARGIHAAGPHRRKRHRHQGRRRVRAGVHVHEPGRVSGGGGAAAQGHHRRGTGRYRRVDPPEPGLRFAHADFPALARRHPAHGGLSGQVLHLPVAGRDAALHAGGDRGSVRGRGHLLLLPDRAGDVHPGCGRPRAAGLQPGVACGAGGERRADPGNWDLSGTLPANGASVADALEAYSNRPSTSFVHADPGDPGDRGGLPAVGGVYRAGGAQGAGGLPGAPGTHARGVARAAATHCRRPEAAAQGRYHSGRCGPLDFLAGAGDFHLHGADGVFRDPLQQDHLRGGRQRGHPGDFGHVGGGDPGDILGGWASNSHYPLLGALRSAAQLISYEVALAFGLLSGVMAAGTLSMQGIIKAQLDQGTWFIFANYGFMIVPFAVYLIAATAETNRAPFDLPEAESELVAGFHTEYSGFRWALYFLAEYANIFVVSAVAVTIFFGGWLRPFPNVKWLEAPVDFGVPVILFAASGVLTFTLVRKLKDPLQQKVLALVALLLLFLAALFAIPAVNAAVIGLFWFLFKVGCIIYLMIWFRGTFPRFRYDQLMNIGWKIAIPVGMAAVFINAVIGMLRQPA